METVIHSSDDITPAYLTEILRRRGILPNGEVARVDRDCRSPFLSEVCTLTLTYSDDAPASAPRRLFMKLLPGGGHIDERGKREIQFYRSILQSRAALPIPEPYYAAYDDNSGALNLLLEDLSESHELLQHELPPTKNNCYLIMEVLARIHAHWWESPELSSIAGGARTEQSLTDEFREMINTYRALADFLGDRLLPSYRAIFEQVIEAYLPLKLARFAGHRNLTLAHGDAHAWNFMYPKREGGLPVLLDWEALEVNLPAFDAAYFITIFWHPARREWLERPLLCHYHAQLLSHGIKGYSWEDCWHDYRLLVIDLLFQPVWWWKTNMPAFLWWYRLERIMMAFDDLGCTNLLNG